MSSVAIRVSPQSERLRALTVEQLFERAESFGNVGIFSSRGKRPPNCYKCSIEFESIPGTSLEAKSEFGRSLPDALIEAIDRAERIVEKFSPQKEGQD